jgi:hypothetical protein
MMVVESAEVTEKTIERLRFWQIIFGGILGFATAFLPMLVTYTNDKIFNPKPVPVKCEGSISITYPKNKTVVYGNQIDVAGVVDPRVGCKNVFLIVGTLDGHNYFTTDSVTVNPDGTWDATAKLYFVPQGTRARIQARLCGEHDAYPPEACLPELPSKGVASNSVVISKQAGVPVKTTIIPNRVGNALSLGVLEFTNRFASGSVTGLFNQYNDYKIVIYYKDTKFGWIKQPYPGDQEGLGWAAILPNGEWSIALRERPSDKLEFVEKKVIALMKKNQPSPDRIRKLSELKTIIKEIR